MKSNYILPLLAFVLSFSSSADTASFQGGSGVFNTPDTHTLDKGLFNFTYSNQVEWQGEYMDNHSFAFSIGLLDGVEITGRNATYTPDLGDRSDLSANIKINPTFTRFKYIDFAAGIMDVGGEVDAFDAKYVVAGKELDDYAYSLGYAISESKQGRLKGKFANITWKPFNWLKVQAEYDASAYNLGFKISTPKSWLKIGKVTASVMGYSSHKQLSDDLFFGLSYTTSMYTSYYPKKKAKHSAKYYLGKAASIDENLCFCEKEALADSHDFELGVKEAKKTLTDRQKLKQLLTYLSEHGFEDVVLAKGLSAQQLVIVLENNIYNRNDMDAVGVILGKLTEYDWYDFKRFSLTIQQYGIPMLRASGSIDDYFNFLNNSDNLRVNIEQAPSKPLYLDVLAQDKKNSYQFKPRLTMWATPITTVGTEIGVFDASIGLASNLDIPLWKGGVLNLYYVGNLYDTSDFKEGGALNILRHKAGLKETMFYQTFDLPSNIRTMAFVGQVTNNTKLFGNTSMWQSETGQHRFLTHVARYKHSTSEDRKVNLASYRYYSPYFDGEAEIWGGRFIQGDKGVVMTASKYFGDTEVTLEYKRTTLESAFGKTTGQHVGLGFSIPLTPRKDFNSSYGQVRGLPKWYYLVSTRVGERLNTLAPGVAGTGRNYFALDRMYYNYDRLGSAYFNANSGRLKDAYETFANED